MLRKAVEMRIKTHQKNLDAILLQIDYLNKKQAIHSEVQPFSSEGDILHPNNNEGGKLTVYDELPREE